MGRGRHIWGLRIFARARHGNAGVEFALILPIMMALLFGVIEIGRALHDYHVASETVRDAARYLGRTPLDCTGAAAGCQPCNQVTGNCGACFFVDNLGAPDGTRVAESIALAMTGEISGTSELLGYWDYPSDASSTIDIQVCRIDNSVTPLQGLYNGAGVVPHVRYSANVPFTFLFGSLVSADPTIDFNVSHNVVVTGE